MESNSKKLSNLLKARFPYIYISTYEEERATKFIKSVVSNQAKVKVQREVLVWTQAIGLKNKDDVILITDAMRAKGLSDGESELGGQKVIVCNGSARLVDGTLAGSVLKMNDAIKLLHFTLGVPLENAIDFASINAATRLSLDKEMGSIEKGKLADLTVLDKDLNVVMVFVNGKLKYSRE